MMVTGMSKNIALIFGLACLLILCVANVKHGISQSSNVYLANTSNQVINGAYWVTLVNCTNITVTNAHGKIWLINTNFSRIFGNSITGIYGDPNNVNYEASIVLLRSNHNDIYQNILSNSERGVLVYTDDPFFYTGNSSGSRYNNIYENKISGSYAGIYCLTGGSNNAIYANIITDCNGGIALRYSNQNEVFKNIIEDCSYAISLSGASDYNAFYNNNFLSPEVYEDHQSLPNLYNLYSVNNHWDAGYPKGGNYWSSYNGTDNDGDGIGDTPFTVYEQIVDRYPLMKPVDIAKVQDANPPLISVISPQNTTYNSGNVSLAFATDEPTSWMGYSLDDQDNATIAGNVTLPELPHGSHSIIVYANDTTGNIGVSETIYFSIAKEQEPEPFPTTLVVAFITSVAIIGAGVLVYFRRRSHARINKHSEIEQPSTWFSKQLFQ
jgi:parallel beta-helix repeat protein